MVRSTYYIYIDGLKIPVNPDKSKRDFSLNSFEYNVIELGDIVIPGTPKLKKWSFSGFFPSDTERWRCEKPETYIDHIEGIMEASQPCEFIIARFLPTGEPYIMTNTQAIVTDFDTEDVFGTNDINYSIALTEYREFGAKIIGG